MSAIILGRFTKQSTETKRYIVDYTEWADAAGETAASFTVTTDDGITVVNSTRTQSIVRVVISGGTHGAQYKVTVRLTTVDGLVEEADFVIKVKDV